MSDVCVNICLCCVCVHARVCTCVFGLFRQIDDQWMMLSVHASTSRLVNSGNEATRRIRDFCSRDRVLINDDICYWVTLQLLIQLS